jgi:hypothetical protein
MFTQGGCHQSRLRPWTFDFAAWPILCLIWDGGGCCIRLAMETRAMKQWVSEESSRPQDAGRRSRVEELGT